MKQDRIWHYFQTRHPESFSGAATRLFHLARQLPAASTVLNVGVGSGQFEALHVYSGLLDAKLAGNCAGADWGIHARVTGAVADNPAVAAYPTAAAAWHRLHARALVKTGNWRAAAAAIERALARRTDDPRDWILLMRARLHLGDLTGYGQARARLLQLIRADPGILRAEIETLDRAADRLRPGRPER